MNSDACRLVALIFCLLLTSVAGAQDTIVIRPEDGGPPIVHRGVITFVNVQEGYAQIKVGGGAKLHFKSDEIISMDSTHPLTLRRWKQIQERRKGGESGNEARGPRERGLGDSDEHVFPNRVESQKIEALIKYLGYDREKEDDLVEYGGKAVSLVIRELSSHDDETREAACRILQRIHDSRSVEGLKERVFDKFDGVRREAIIALADYTDSHPEVCDILLERAREEAVPEVMRELMTILGEVGSRVTTVRKAIRTDCYEASRAMVVYYYACQAMMGDRDVGPRLGKYLATGLDDDVFIARALAEVDRSEAIEYLIKHLRVSRGAIRREDEICGALRSITGKDFGYESSEDLLEKGKAKQAWLDWWDRGMEEGGMEEESEDNSSGKSDSKSESVPDRDSDSSETPAAAGIEARDWSRWKASARQQTREGKPNLLAGWATMAPQLKQ